MFPEGLGYSSITGDFEVQSDIYIDDRAGIERIELKLAMEYDYIKYKADYENYIIKTFDITDAAHPDTTENTPISVDNYTKYSFDFKEALTDGEFQLNRGFLTYAVVVTFSDGHQSVLFNLT